MFKFTFHSTVNPCFFKFFNLSSKDKKSHIFQLWKPKLVDESCPVSAHSLKWHIFPLTYGAIYPSILVLVKPFTPRTTSENIQLSTEVVHTGGKIILIIKIMKIIYCWLLSATLHNSELIMNDLCACCVQEHDHMIEKQKYYREDKMYMEIYFFWHILIICFGYFL